MKATVNKATKEICLTLSFQEWVALPSASDPLDYLPVQAEEAVRRLLETLDRAVLTAWPPEQENPFFEL